MTEETTEIAAEEAEDEEITGLYEYEAIEMRDILAERLRKRAEEFETEASTEASLGAANRYKVATYRWGAEELRNLATQFSVAHVQEVRTFKRSEIGWDVEDEDDIAEVRIDEALAADLARVTATLEEAQQALEKANSVIASKNESIRMLEGKLFQITPSDDVVAENAQLKADLHELGLKFEALEATTKLLQRHLPDEVVATPAAPLNVIGTPFPNNISTFPGSTGIGVQ